MRNKLSVITQGWHSKCSSQQKIAIEQKVHKILNLSHKRKHQGDMQMKTAEQPKKLVQDEQSHLLKQIKRLIKKLTSFIQKVEETMKKILYQKDVKWYITYAHTSESEIIDNFNKALDKFKTILYRLKQELRTEDDSSTDTKLVVDRHSSSSSGQNHVNQPHKQDLKEIKKTKFNYDVLSFVLQYFEDHMIPETHWSLKEKLKKKCEKVNIFSKYFGGWNLSNCKKDQSQQGLDNQLPPQLHIAKAVSNVVEQINRQQQQLAQRSPINHAYIHLKPVEQTLEAILKIQDLKPIEQMSSTQQIVYLLDLESKIFVSGEFVESAAFFQDDITTLPQENYHKVWQFINENNFGNEETIREQYKMMKMLMIITNASVIRELEYDTIENSWFKKLVFGLSFPRYYLDYSRARLQNHKFLRKPNVETMKSIWNLPENGLIKELKKPLIFDYISCNVRFWIQRTKSRNLKCFRDRKYDAREDVFVQRENTFKVRLLNYKQLQTSTIGHTTWGKQIYETIIIHYHGGGFIALSSCTSQSYTRKWANSLQVPVFSVDYGKPPEHRFPVPVMDCLDAYVFISLHVQKYFPQIRPKRILVTGDSAGGNLACSLTALALKLQLPRPEGLLLVYPAVDTRTRFTPSRINSFNDIILYPTLLLLCMQQYLGNEENQYSQLASPILLTEDYVNDNGDKRWPLNWPKTIIMVGKKDPLFDDSLRLCEKLAASNVEFHCEIYKHLSHAFLSIDKMLPECAYTIDDSIKFFKMLIKGEYIGVKKLL